MRRYSSSSGKVPPPLLSTSLLHQTHDFAPHLLIALILGLSWCLEVSSAAATATTMTTAYATTPVHPLEKQDVAIPWLIIGGGIHGVHIAARLLEEGNLPRRNLCIVDNNERLLQRWRSRTGNTGMEYLRSASGHHLDPEEESLRRQFFDLTGDRTAKNGRRRRRKRKNRPHAQEQRRPPLSNDYGRPRLDVFDRHCDFVVEKYDLDELHRRGKVTAMELHDDGVRIRVESPAPHNEDVVIYDAERVVLALGNDDPVYPHWVDENDVRRGLVRHVLDDDRFFTPAPPAAAAAALDHGHGDGATLRSVAIVGGGMTGAHKALELVRTTSPETTRIHLISRRPLKEQQFDTHQDWMMDQLACRRSKNAGGYGVPERQRIFFKTDSFRERRNIIARERVAGTVTPALARGDDGLRFAIEHGRITWHQAEITGTEKCPNHDDDDGMKLSLSSGETIRVDEILLATGFGKKLPGEKLLQRDLVNKAGLKVSDYCGYPIVDENLSWHPRVFVTGGLAELELGPSARNIAGARLAAERIVRVLLDGALN